ncbi:MAG: hypothetical protein IKJ74_01185 [Clostridia bacterium]|nr:hypothetical protein [Clostridia bacterium]
MKIVLIGDSIRAGYDKYVKMALEGVAEVYYSKKNNRFTTQILRHLYDWKIEMGCGDDVDLVHWNAGLWDDMILPDGKNLVSLATYRENVGRICDMIEILFPKAKMIFATSTPCNEEFFKTYHYKRTNRDTELYNEAASEVVLARGGTVNDLYALLEQDHMRYHSDQTHYYTKEGTRVITDQVLRCLEDALQIKGKALDYDVLFAEKEDIVGL